MPMLSDGLPYANRLQLALRIHTPSRLAMIFASFSGQFYDRSAFDALARQVSDLYDLEGQESADVFREQLDRRIGQRDRGPVAWDETNGEGRVA